MFFIYTLPCKVEISKIIFSLRCNWLWSRVDYPSQHIAAHYGPGVAWWRERDLELEGYEFFLVKSRYYCVRFMPIESIA